MTDQASTGFQILRSTFIVGGASAISMLLGLIRNKALALMLGPAGFGLMGLYLAIVDVGRSVAGMGVNQSGVRQIAEAVAQDGKERVSVTAFVLRRASLVLGLLGALALLVFAGPIATLSFGNDEHAYAVRLLSLAVLFNLVTEGQGALLQGLRRIGDLARMRILGALYSAIAIIIIVYFLGQRGVAVAVVVGAVLSTLTVVYYVRRLNMATPDVPLVQVRTEAAELLKLGSAFMVSGFLTMGASYAVLAIVTAGEGGLHAAGLYQAAWTLGGLYSGYILQAMGTDFYPRLVGAVADRGQRNRLINEQMTISLMLAGPGILGTLALAAPVLGLLYSRDFTGAADTLRWICCGMALRVITWPPGFLIVSMNEKWVFMATEVAWGIANVGLTLALVPHWGPAGAGIAFAASYVLHAVIVYSIVSRRYSFVLERSTLKASVLFVLAVGVALCIFELMEGPAALLAALGITVVVGMASVRALVRLVPGERLPRPVYRVLVSVHLIDKAAG